MATQENIVLETDPGLVEWRTDICGWVGKDGKYYGKTTAAKDIALYANSTHKKCDRCENIVKQAWSLCDHCRDKKAFEKYLQMPEVEWDGETCIYSDAFDKYFFSAEDVLTYMEEEEIDLDTNPRLILCHPNHMTEVDLEQWNDLLPEDRDFEDVISKEVQEKIKELNEAIKKCGPISWSPGNKRITLRP